MTCVHNFKLKMFVSFLISKLKKPNPYMEDFFSLTQLQTYFASNF